MIGTFCKHVQKFERGQMYRKYPEQYLKPTPEPWVKIPGELRAKSGQ